MVVVFAGGGQLYMWGKIKNTGDDWMYPKPLMDLRLCTCLESLSLPLCRCSFLHLAGHTYIYSDFKS